MAAMVLPAKLVSPLALSRRAHLHGSRPRDRIQARPTDHGPHIAWKPPDAHVVAGAAMSLETLLLWIVIGLIAGWLASVVVGGGYGLIGDVVIG
ncbi:MAG TPA: hypothetical protein VI456_01975, partial [Polyangia bacterium]